MALATADVSLRIFLHSLKQLDALLAKGEAFMAARKLSDEQMLSARLYPDMLPLAGQVQICADAAKGAGARLAGVDIPSFPDTEKTMAELRARTAKTIAFLQTLKPEQVEGGEARNATVTFRGQSTTYDGRDFLLHRAIPNFFFHMTMTHAILRHIGVDVGKTDFIGQMKTL